MSSKRVLIVEDEPATALYLRRFMKELGYEVVGTVDDGAAAIERFAATRPEVVLMDVYLEGALDGVETARAIRRQSNACIVFLTAYADDSTVRRAREAEADGYVIKPVEPDLLRATLEVALYRRLAGPRKSVMDLVTSQQGLMQALSSSTDGVMGFDRAGVCTFANAVAARMWGGHAEALAGRTLHSLLHEPETVPGLPCEACAARAKGDATHDPGGRLRRQDGGIVPVEYTAHPLVGAHGTEGTIVSLLGRPSPGDSTRESTYRERQQAAVAHLGQRALQDVETQPLLQETVDLVRESLQVDSSALLELQPDGSALLLRAAAHLQLQAEECRAVSHLDEGPAGYALRQGLSIISNDLRHEGRFEVAAELQLEGADSCVCAIVHGDDGPYGVLSAWSRSGRQFTQQDVIVLESFASLLSIIMRQRRAQELLRQSEQQLFHSQKMEALGLLAGGVAHDLNNLLTVINGYGELLLMTLDRSDQRHGYVREIEEAGERAASLTRQLLTFSRHQVVTPRVLDLNGVIANLEKMLRRLIGEDVKLITRLDPQAGHVKADAGQMEQVVMNLVVNARDAMPRGGRLEIETTAVEGDFVSLRVSDTGCGMDSGVAARIFEPFYTTKEPGRGTGLGLSTVYSIVQQCGGGIAVESAPGRGTRFEILLPVTHDEPPAADVIGSRVRETRRAETVLVVEDDARVRSLVAQVLERGGYRVLVAEGGDEALSICREIDVPLDLLLTDTVMPGLSGCEVAAEVVRMREHTRVLFMSGYTDDAMERYGVLLDEVQFLAKPFKPEVLLRAVRKALDNPAGGEPN